MPCVFLTAGSGLAFVGLAGNGVELLGGQRAVVFEADVVAEIGVVHLQAVVFGEGGRCGFGRLCGRGRRGAHGLLRGQHRCLLVVFVGYGIKIGFGKAVQAVFCAVFADQQAAAGGDMGAADAV